MHVNTPRRITPARHAGTRFAYAGVGTEGSKLVTVYIPRWLPIQELTRHADDAHIAVSRPIELTIC